MILIFAISCRGYVMFETYLTHINYHPNFSKTIDLVVIQYQLKLIEN